MALGRFPAIQQRQNSTKIIQKGIGDPEVSGRWVATPLFLCLLVIERLGGLYGSLLELVIL